MNTQMRDMLKASKDSCREQIVDLVKSRVLTLSDQFHWTVEEQAAVADLCCDVSALSIHNTGDLVDVLMSATVDELAGLNDETP